MSTKKRNGHCYVYRSQINIALSPNLHKDFLDS